ncbi:WhiB family transcriptional regulator [Streptomyces sp. MBT97]|uniref:WhiB family transcriptional regulator n=1 Tax=Streptomyces sp. MBT97 TaxID=2800411 RepID=UPI00190B2FAC|nr:WhiB family transcriptional regulator [Streptomyces sp. MBT97]MBK3631606.1 WhiB family transcriptional regulator [Streptomyces sp. MBT97]
MDREWELKALCKDMDPEIFFSKRTLGLAKQTCRECPVQMACLEAALVREAGVAKAFRIGMVANTTGAQRYAIDKQRKSAKAATAKAETAAEPPRKKPTGRPKGSGGDLAPCGTPAAYQRHIRNKEPVDQACKVANADSRRLYRRTGSTKVPATR